MIHHPIQYTELLTSDGVDKILHTAIEILSVHGMLIQSESACKLLADAGADVDIKKNHVKFNEQLVRNALKSCPAEFTLEARNSDKNITIGSNKMAICPGYGSAFIADIYGTQRNAGMNDFDNFAKLACKFDIIDITGGVLVEPNDIAPAIRPLELTASLIKNSDKPFMGSVSNSKGPDETLELLKIVFGDISKRHVVTALVNINSPLRLDKMMINALVKYSRNNQPVILTPGILMGITAPLTTSAALAQAFAEILGALTLTQIVRKKTPVIIGLGGFGSDLRKGRSGFGRPENSLAIIAGSQIARKLNLPFRCSAAVTGSRQLDSRCGYESMSTAMAAHNAGVHFCLQAAGILDSINTMCYEKFIIDIEIWSYLKRITQQIDTCDKMLNTEVIHFDSDSYLTCSQTLKNMRKEIYDPVLITPETYESWIKSNGKNDIGSRANKIKNDILNSFELPSLPDDIQKEIDKYLSLRRKDLL